MTFNQQVDHALMVSFDTSISEKPKPLALAVTTVSVKEIQVEPSKSQSISLPPRDQGRGAVTALVAALFIDATIVAVQLSYGVFQDYYTETFVDHSKASWIGVLSNGLVYLGAPAVTYCCQEFSHPRKYYVCLGLFLCCLSLLLSAFTSNLSGLIIVQGLLYGVGAVLVDIPLLISLNTWFDKRRGFAYGLLFGGTDLLGALFTLLSAKVLRTYGLQITFFVYFTIVFSCAVPATFLLQERPTSPAEVTTSAPVSATSKSPQIKRANTALSIITTGTSLNVPPSANNTPFSPSLTRKHTWPVQQPRKRYYQRGIFYLLTISNLLQACAIYLPFIYLPAFATQSGHSKDTAALILAIANVGMLVGDLSFGKLSDKIHVNILIFISSGVSAIVTFCLWGLSSSSSVAHSRALLIAFGFVFGVFGGGFIVLWARMGTLFGERDAAMVYGTLSFGRGVGSILSGPISQALLRVGPVPILAVGQYGCLVVFVGVCMAASALMGPVAIAALWWKKGDIFDSKIYRLESGPS